MCREKSICAHCATIIVQLWRKKVVHIVLRLLYNMTGKKLCALCQELKRYFPPTSLFRFRTFSPLILVVNLIQPFHFYYAVVSLSCNKAILVLFSTHFDSDQRTQICLLTLILCNVGTGSAGHKHILDFCSLLGAKGQVSETCHYEAEDKGLE